MIKTSERLLQMKPSLCLLRKSFYQNDFGDTDGLSISFLRVKRNLPVIDRFFRLPFRRSSFNDAKLFWVGMVSDALCYRKVWLLENLWPRDVHWVGNTRNRRSIEKRMFYELHFQLFGVWSLCTDTKQFADQTEQTLKVVGLRRLTITWWNLVWKLTTFSDS